MASNTVRTARRRTLRIAAAALTVAAGLTLTACSGSDDAGTKSSGRLDSAAAAADRDGAGSSAEAQGSESQTHSGTMTDPGANADSSTKADSGAKAKAGKQSGGGSDAARGDRAGSGSQRCHTSGLKAAFATGDDAAPDPNAGGATTTSIVLTNASGRTCTIGGFPGVDLQTENGGGVWSLARSSAKYGSITLGPGDSTDFTINIALAGEGEENFWMPAHVAITPPNETTSLTVDWPWGELLDQRGATHPATFVNPIG